MKKKKLNNTKFDNNKIFTINKEIVKAFNLKKAY